MAGSFSDFLELEVLDHLFGKGLYNPPTIYVGLSTANPLDDASGLAEPAGNGYARVATVGADWNVAAAGHLDNANDVESPTATGAWGVITHFALFDAAAAGNMLGHGDLDDSKDVGVGDTVKFAAGDLDVTLD